MAKLRDLYFKKILAGFAVLFIMAGLLVLLSPRVSVADEPVALTVTGNGVEKEVKFTMSQLRALPQATYTYSGYNRWPSLQIFKDTTGPTLKTILNAAGLRDNATMIRIKSTTSLNNCYTRQQLLDDLRYYFPAGETAGDCPDWPPTNRSEEGKVPVETMLALDLEGGKLIYGQRTPLEPTCCKGYQINGLLPGCTIEVTTDPPAQWEAPDAYPAPGTVLPGTEVTVQHGDGTPYGAIVYYTLDGSEPTIESNIFNISYPHFRPWLNKPIPINGNVTIKTRTIGMGELDSEVRTYQYNIGSLACTVEGAGLTKPVVYTVETLKGMPPTEGNYQISEGGGTVTLAGKGVLLGILLDQLNASSKWEVEFVTATGEEYEGGTVQELKDQQCMLAYEVNGQEIADVSGEQTVKIQILRNLDDGDLTGNRLRYVNAIKLVNVDDEITISSIKLLDYTGQPVTSVAPGGGYCIEAQFINDVNAARDALLLIQVRNGEAATGGSIVGSAAVQTVVDVTGGKAKAEFTLPANLSGKAYVDVFVWDSCGNHNPLGRDSHELSFNIE